MIHFTNFVRTPHRFANIQLYYSIKLLDQVETYIFVLAAVYCQSKGLIGLRRVCHFYYCTCVAVHILSIQFSNVSLSFLYSHESRSIREILVLGSLTTKFGADVCHTNLAAFVKFCTRSSMEAYPACPSYNLFEC